MTGPILVTGAEGMLGSDLVEYFSNLLGPNQVIATDHHNLDITQEQFIERAFAEFHPRVVINAAAYTNVDGAEKEREKAYQINAEGPKHLAKLCHERGIPLVHFTTDYVFDGTGHKLWTESDTPNPPKPNYYAETKLIGEQHVAAISEGLVLRVQWLYGKKRDRFTILKDKEIFTPFNDQFGAPTWTWQISELVAELLKKNARGTFHIAYDDYASWFDVYEFVKKEMGYQTKLVSKKTADVPLPAKRPLFCAMSNKKLLHFLGREKLGSWKEPLKAFLHQKTGK